MGHKGNPQKQNNKTLYRQAGCCKFHVLVSLKKVNLNSTKLICWVAWVLKRGCLKLCTSNSHSSIYSGTVLVKFPNIKNTYQEIKEVIIFLEEKIEIWMLSKDHQYFSNLINKRTDLRVTDFTAFADFWH